MWLHCFFQPAYFKEKVCWVHTIHFTDHLKCINNSKCRNNKNNNLSFWNAETLGGRFEYSTLFCVCMVICQATPHTALTLGHSSHKHTLICCAFGFSLWGLYLSWQSQRENAALHSFPCTAPKRVLHMLAASSALQCFSTSLFV